MEDTAVVRSMFYPFSNSQLAVLIRQLDMFIQLLYQTLLLSQPERSREEEKQERQHQNNSYTTHTVSEEAEGKDEELEQEEKYFKNLQYRVYSMLYDFIAKRDGKLKDHESLPYFQIPWIRT